MEFVSVSILGLSVLIFKIASEMKLLEKNLLTQNQLI